jgi:hypothetical protein
LVEEVNLSQNVSLLRRALGDTAQESRYIATIPGKGYRFIAEVKAVQRDGAEHDGWVIERHSRAQVVIEQARPWRVWVGAGVAVVLLIGILSIILVWHLRAAARLTEKDTIVLADFSNSTGDPVFDDTLKQALSVAVRQSNFLGILSDDKVWTTCCRFSPTHEGLFRSPRQSARYDRTACGPGAARRLPGGSWLLLGECSAPGL